MPELPEVQTIANSLKELEGLKIENVIIQWKKSFVGDPDFNLATLLNITRRAKYVKIHLSSGEYLYIHLRMSGRLAIENKKRPYTKHEQVIFILNQNKFLIFHDTRKFGRIERVLDPIKFEEKLGVEPFEMDIIKMASRLRSKNRALKPLLLDQSFIAGLGNIYVDEALFEAKLHPLTKANTLTEKEASTLLKACQSVLMRGLENQGTSLGKGKANYRAPNGKKGENQHALRVYGRTGKECVICKGSIVRMIVAQRSTHVCTRCQKI